MLRAGTSITGISPSKGIELAGYPHFFRHNTGVHDPLYASCLLLDDGKMKIAFVCMDILFFSKKYVREVRQRVAEKIDLAPANIMISCSHTHSGPWASGRLDLEALEKGLRPDYGYIEDLKEKIIDLIDKANNDMFQAKIGSGFGICGKEQGIGGNRRAPGGLSDPEVWVIGVKDLKDDFKAAFVKYSLHPTVIHEDSTLVSADYPAYIRKYLAEIKPQMIMLFAQGTSGDQSTRYFRKGQSFDEAERIGNEIGKISNQVLDSLQFSRKLQISRHSKEININLRVLPSEEEAARNVKTTGKYLEKLNNQNASYLEIQNANLSNLGAEHTLCYTRLRNKGIALELETDELPAEVQVIRIGDTRIVGLQGEIFVEFGLEIQKRSPFKKTFIVELANGALPGYVCTEKAIAEGGYEVETTLMDGKSGKKLVDTTLELLGKSNF
jgi:neutral ceramidase